MKISVIIPTRNRATGIVPCLDSIAVAFAKVGSLNGEIVIVDNGSTDNTIDTIKGWASANPFPVVRLLLEPRTGVGRAYNLALRTAQGELLVFTDDDCRLSKDYVNDLLRHAAADKDFVLRGGRIELGDQTDLPLTINTAPERIRWNRRMNSIRHQVITGQINGCNMTMPRALVQKLGPFDERFGPGSVVGSGCDSDYLFRAYLAYITLEYVPDMAVAHYHGRKTAAAGRALMQKYTIANGALLAKHVWKHPVLGHPFYRDVKRATREIITGTNTFLPAIGFSHRDRVAYAVRGALRYLLYAGTPAAHETIGHHRVSATDFP